MAGTIEHYWNGTILTVISDSGTSSCDLKGIQGDTGPRGPQGPAGNIGLTGEQGIQGEVGPQGPQGEVDYSRLQEYLPLAGGSMTGGLAMGSNKITALAKPENATDAANKQYVDETLANAITSGTIDLSGYTTKEYVDTAVVGVQTQIDNCATKDYVNNKFHFSEEIPTTWANGDIWLKPAGV